MGVPDFRGCQFSCDTGHDMLERDFKVMKDNYVKICSENRQLMHCLPGSRKTRKREEQEMKP